MTTLHEIIIAPRVTADQQAIELLRGLPSSIIGDVLGGRLIGTTALRPVNRSSIYVCGNALTVRVRSGDNLLIHKALELIEPGDILIVDGEGDTSRALVGEIMMTSAMTRGAVGFVMDGAIRDVEAFEEHRFPCWSRGISLRGPYKDGPGSINVPVMVGGMQVNPGDIVVGDADGLIAIPRDLAAQVADLGLAKVRHEKQMIEAIKAGSYSSAWVDALLKNKFRWEA
jgi:regulator of RNase E activity RraA